MAVYTVLWTEDILAETVFNLRRDHPKWEGGQIANIVETIKKIFPEEGHRVRDYNFAESKDECDGHVKGAAIAGNADILLTNNVKDFVDDVDECPYEVYTPDDFFMLVWKSAPALVESVTHRMNQHFRSKEVLYSPAEKLRAAKAYKFSKVVAGILDS